MRIRREWLTIRTQMVIIACMAMCFAIVVWIMPPAALQPRLVVLNPAIDIGMVRQVARGGHTWVLKNMGEAPLMIWLEDIGDCGCPNLGIEEARVDGKPGVISLSRDPTHPIGVPPGGQATIAVAWATKRCMGRSRSYVDLRTNDPTNARYRLSVFADIRSDEVSLREQ
jgi:hypothetical protein